MQLAFRVSRFIRILVMFLFAGLLMEAALIEVAEARAGRGRSFGRSSQSQQRSVQRQNNQQNNNQKAQQNNTSQASSPSRGGFLKGLAGGLAGGFIGSMLFSSLAHGSGLGGGFGGGGIGLFDILLIGGIAYLAFRWWKSRQAEKAPAMAAGNYAYQAAPLGNQQAFESDNRGQQPFLSASTPFPGSTDNLPLARLDEDQASDIFFRIQGAWTRRDLSAVRELLTAEIAAALQNDLDELIRNKQINRLENIAVRRVQIGEPWREQDSTFIAAHFVANMLDYTVDEQSAALVRGSQTDPVKFEENWVFCLRDGENKWLLAGIEQVN